jgi:AmmeMemoRadiSam system protein A
MIAVDQAAAEAVVAADQSIEFDRAAFRNEHPVENQLPFIQSVCPGARIVPVVIRQPSPQNAEILANALASALGDGQALVVASTDLSHYHPYGEARQIDQVALQAIASLDPQAVVASQQRCTDLGIAEQPLTLCSQGAVLAALEYAAREGASRSDLEDRVYANVLHYATSGDVPIGQRENVVGYAAMALWLDEHGDQAPESFEVPSLSEIPDPIPLSLPAQEELLALARRTIAQYLATESLPSYVTEDPALLQPMGAYVTYEEEGALRGCLGRLEGDRPAYLNVQYAALAAALGDPRFPAITSGELEELTLEITLLQPMRQVENARAIQIGSDGVLMRVGEENSALFLPQVPVDEGWDLEETLVNLCRKAGLPDDAWERPEARFYVFTGQRFGEDGR